MPAIHILHGSDASEKESLRMRLNALEKSNCRTPQSRGPPWCSVVTRCWRPIPMSPHASGQPTPNCPGITSGVNLRTAGWRIKTLRTSRLKHLPDGAGAFTCPPRGSGLQERRQWVHMDHLAEPLSGFEDWCHQGTSWSVQCSRSPTKSPSLGIVRVMGSDMVGMRFPVSSTAVEGLTLRSAVRRADVRISAAQAGHPSLTTCLLDLHVRRGRAIYS